MPQTDVAIAKVWYLLFGVTCWGNLIVFEVALLHLEISIPPSA